MNLEPLLELILEPILGFLLEAAASPKRGSKMNPNPRAKIAFFHWFYSILVRIRRGWNQAALGGASLPQTPSLAHYIFD